MAMITPNTIRAIRVAGEEKKTKVSQDFFYSRSSPATVFRLWRRERERNLATRSCCETSQLRLHATLCHDFENLGRIKLLFPKKNGIESISWSRNWRLRVVQNIGSSNVVLWINTNLKYYKMCLLTHHQFWRLHRLLNGQHNLKTEMNKGKIVWLNKCNNQGMNILYSPARTKEWYRSVKDKMTRLVASITISDKVATEGFKQMNHSSKTVLTGLLYPRQLIC